MQVTLDTSTLIRFFTNDIPQKAEKVGKLLEEKSLAISDVVFPELEYVLGNVYKSDRAEITTVYRFLLGKKNIKTSVQVKKAFTIFEKTDLDMADCIIAASSLKGSLASFDKKLLQVEGITSFWKQTS